MSRREGKAFEGGNRKKKELHYISFTQEGKTGGVLPSRKRSPSSQRGSKESLLKRGKRRRSPLTKKKKNCPRRRLREKAVL